ncbi:hypothetical protein ACYSNM_10825 [Myroides sp. LJL116]
MQKKTTSLLEQIQNRLDSLTSNLISDIELIGQETLSTMNSTSSSDKVSTIYFEYSFEDLQLYYWKEDQSGDLIGSSVTQLPTHNKEGVLPKVLLDSIMDLEDDLYLEDKLSDEDILDEIEHFNQQRCDMFEKWFLSCWSLASGKDKCNTKAYFSVHDSYFKIELN